MEPAEHEAPPAARAEGADRTVPARAAGRTADRGADRTAERAAERTAERTGPAQQVRPAGVAGLSLPSRVVVAVAVAAVAVAAVVHLAMVFLHVAPSNEVSKKHDEVIDSYIYPEFEQNWKLFAPNPLQQNIAVHVRARVATGDGGVATTGWFDLSAMDGEGIRHNIAPSHTQQNELRRAWEFFSNNHNDKGRPVGLRGELSEAYIKRIVMWRLGTEQDGGTIERIQVRSAVTPVERPEWSSSTDDADTKTQYRLYPWWQVSSADVPRGGNQ